MDLEDKLKLLNADLFGDLQDIKKFCGTVWKDRYLPWFTNHDCKHSKEIVHILGQILKPLESNPQFLNEHELFILLSSAYLHDIGMQFLKVDDITIDKMTEAQYTVVRKRHADESYNIILKLVSKSIERDDFHPPQIDEEYIPSIARVSKGHATDYFNEIIEEFKKDPLTPKGRIIRGELLTALLMLSDELDLQCKRVSFQEMAKFTPSIYSLVHWFKHHYVDFVEIENGSVKITLKFPPNSDGYKDLIQKLIGTKLKEQITRVYPILMDSTSGLLHLRTSVYFDIRTDKNGTKREMSEEVLSEAKRILKYDSDISSSNIMTERIISSYPKPSNIFTGRRDELKRFNDALKKSSFISIEGLGGIGKTEFAAKCIEEFLLQDRIVWFDCLPDSKLDALIESSGYPDVLRGENKTELAKYSGFTDLIERDEKIIFLDNFQDILDLSFKNFFIFSERRLRKAKIILVSRENPDTGIRTAPVPLNGLKNNSLEYAIKLIKTYYEDVNISDDDLKEICDNLSGHPFAIELAIQLLRYGETPDNILQKIIKEKEKSEQLSSKLLDELFKHPKSTDEERKFMLHISVFRGEIDKNAILYLVDAENFSEILHKLYDKKMISRSIASNLYNTHPLIREFCYQKLENKKDIHLKAAEFLQMQRKDRFESSLEEEIFHHLYIGKDFEKAADLVSEQGKSFILLGYTNSLIDMIDKIILKISARPEFHIFYGDILTIRGKWDHALKYYEKAFSYPECDEKIMAESYIKFGEILFRKGEVKKSLNYFEDAQKICQKKGYKREEARSLNDIGLVSRNFGNVSLTEEKFKEALLIRQNIEDKEGIADTLNNIALHLSDLGQYDRALSKSRECLKIRKDISDKRGISLALFNIALIHQRKEDLKEALDCLNESLQLAEEIGEKQIKCGALQGIAGIYNEKGQTDEALKFINQSLQIAEEIGYQHGIADFHSLMGKFLYKKGKIKEPLEHFEESLRISNEMGTKSSIAACLNDIGNVLFSKKNYEGALKKYKESLIISEEMGFKPDMSSTYYNLGNYFEMKKDYAASLNSYLKSFAIRKEIGFSINKTLDSILRIKKHLGFHKFSEIVKKSLETLDENLKASVNNEEFFKTTTTHRETPKIGRNEPCPCGSGKKYKKCCGAAA